jgi:tripartite-type tricarboxylate transporter receptor subunit TctC
VTAIRTSSRPVRVVIGFPASGPLDQHARLWGDALGKVLGGGDVREGMVAQGADPACLDAAGFRRFLEVEMPKWAAAVKASGAQLD